MKRNNIFLISVAALLVSSLYSCDKEVPPCPDPYIYVYSFGKEYTFNPESVEGMVILDGNAQRLELSLSDIRNNYMPVEDIDYICVGNFVGESIEMPNFTFETDQNNIDTNSFEYEELGEGETIHHSYGWFNLQHVKDTYVPDKLIVTLPENNTGQLRGLCIQAGLIKSESPFQVYVSSIFIYQKPLENEEQFPMKIRYKGVVYSTMAELDENGDYIYDNPEFEKMVNYLDSTPGIDAVVMDDTIVDYFDTDEPAYQEFISKVDRPVDPSLDIQPYKYHDISSFKSNELTRADGFQHWRSTDIGYYAAFSDGEFEGKYLTYTPSNFHNSQNLRDLKMNDMNDKISSVAVYYGGADPNVCAVLTVWDDGNYNYGDTGIPRSKHRVSFIASYNNRKLSRNSLKNVKLINSSKSWNDRISSLSFHFGYFDSKPLDF